VTLAGTREKGTLTYQFEATGTDAGKVKEAVTTMEGYIKEGLDQIKQQQANGGPEAAMAKSAGKVLETIKVTANDNQRR